MVIEVATHPGISRVWELLGAIPDPEIPVISIVDLGIVRDVRGGDAGMEVVLTPTYSGCPAKHAIEEDIRRALRENGIDTLTIRTTLSPAWTTDWISESGREKLRAHGIAPPHSAKAMDAHRINLFSRSIACPLCGSEATERLSEFGSTACKALYRCLDCREPFDYFKPL